MRKPLLIDPPLSKRFLGTVGLFWVFMSLSGCFNPFLQQNKPVQDPPLIPAPPAAEVSSGKGQPPVFVGTYADIAKLRDQGGSINPLLFEAVSQAIRIGVLKPSGPLDQFHPEKPIDLKLFRTWATAFQAAEAGVPVPPDGASPVLSQPVPAPAAGKADDLSSPMNPQQLELIAPDMQLGTHRIADTHNLSREALCGLGVFLAKKYTEAMSLSPQAMEAMTPGANNANGDEALSLFKDFATLSAWAKPFVAVAYRDALLQKAFNLNTNQLTIEDGFNPTQPATRAEAIVLLHVLFETVNTPAPEGQHQPNIQKQKPKPTGMKGTYSPSELRTPEPGASSKATPLPLASQKTIQQSGPQGSQRFQKSVVAH